MNLIQIKQIDGLESALNSLAGSQYDLDNRVSGSFESYDNFWDQLDWTEDSITVDSYGETFDGDANIAFAVNNGGFSCLNNSYFKQDLKISGDLIINSNTGQLIYKNSEGESVRFNGAISPNHETVTATSYSLTNDSYIVGVDTAYTSAPVTIKLPPPKAGKEIKIKDEGFAAAVNTIFVEPYSSETIEGGLNIEVSGNGAFVNVYSNGVNWFVLNQSGVV